MTIDELAKKIISLQSFDYPTLTDAKKTILDGNTFYIFDALSLCVYDHNLSYKEYFDLGNIVTQLWEATADREQQKERLERGTLFHYLLSEQKSIRDYKITKTKRPDFMLEGEQRIGIEVTSLTTEEDQVLFTICRELFGHGYSVAEIKKKASDKHGRDKVEKYSFWDEHSIGSPLYDVNYRKKLYAELIARKFVKYKLLASEYDEFIILADASLGTEITSQNDVDDVYNLAKEIQPEVVDMTVAILWVDNTDSREKVTERKRDYCRDLYS